MGLYGWDQKKVFELTIDGSKIEEDMIDLPVMIHLASGTGITNADVTPVFDELLSVSGTKKIAITTYSGDQCYVEIEDWDWGAEDAWLWTKVPALTSGTDEILYLYYDSTQPDNTTYVGDVTDLAATNVWNSNYVGVWHMAQDPSGGPDAIKDSTSNNNHGTSAGSMTTGDLVDGKVGKAIDFDGSDDYINMGSDLSLHINDNYTIDVMATFSALGATNNRGMFFKGVIGSAYIILEKWYGTNAAFRTGLAEVTSSYPSLDTSNWFQLSARCNGKNSTGQSLYVSGEISGSELDNSSTADVSSDQPVWIGRSQNYHTGLIGEVRISNTARSPAWIKATYYSNFDDFITFVPVPIYYFSGTVTEGLSATAISGAVIYMYRRDNGQYLGQTTSSGDGSFYVETAYGGTHFLVCLDNEGGISYNDLIYGDITPVTISG